MRALAHEVAISLVVNGRPWSGLVPARLSLADFLRETLSLTATHLGCEHGVCGACTVMVDGMPQRGCLTLAAAADGAEVTTVEGLEGPEIEALRIAFTAEHALQCGFCTPGMLITAMDMIRRGVCGSETQVRLELTGNLCRCTGYRGIVRAIGCAARSLGSASA